VSDPAGRIPVRRGSRSLGKFDQACSTLSSQTPAFFVIASCLTCNRGLPGSPLANFLCYKNHQVPDLRVPGQLTSNQLSYTDRVIPNQRSQRAIFLH